MVHKMLATLSLSLSLCQVLAHIYVQANVCKHQADFYVDYTYQCVCMYIWRLDLIITVYTSFRLLDWACFAPLLANI